MKGLRHYVPQTSDCLSHFVEAEWWRCGIFEQEEVQIHHNHTQ